MLRLTLLLSLLFVGSILNAQVVTDGLISYWSFDQADVDGNTVLDRFGGQNAIATGGSPIIVAGKIGDAIQFDKSYYLIVAESLSDAKLPIRDISIEVWVKADQFGEWGGYFGAFQDNGSFEKGWILGTNNQISFAISTEEPDDGNGVLTYVKDPSQNFNKGEWLHVVGTYDGEVTKLYVNGELITENDQHKGNINYPADGDDHPDARVAIGTYLDANEDDRQNFTLDELRLYEKALSVGEVSQNFNSKTGITAVDPIGKISTVWATIRNGVMK